MQKSKPCSTRPRPRGDAIYLLDGWETSVGARGELRTALCEGCGCVHLESNGTPDAPLRD